MSTVPPGQASRQIVRDTIRDGLRAAATDAGYTLDDPHAGSRDGSEFVLTSFPDRDTQHPHVVVREVGDSGERRDSRVDLWLHDYQVRAECFGRSATEAMKLRAGVKEWFQVEYETLRDAGFVDVGIDSSTPMEHESQPSVDALQVTYSGDLYTA